MADKTELITTMQVARMLDTSDRTIRRWMTKPKDPLMAIQKGSGQSTLFDPRSVLFWAGRNDLLPTAEIELNLNHERALNLRADTEVKQEKLQQIRKQTAPIAVIAAVLGDIGGQISAILESIPLKVSRRVPGMKATEIEIITREVIKAQNVAASVRAKIDDHLPDE